MTSREARQILLRYPPDTGHASDPEMAAALAQVEADPELHAWFEQHCAFQRRVRDQLRSLPVPERTLIAPNVVPGPAFWWARAAVVTTAAAAVIALAVGIWFWSRPAVPDQFDNYRSRMARGVLRQYQMDVHTADMSELRQHLAKKGAPADYQIPAGLKELPLTGGGVLRWRDKPVSMVCFDRGQKQMAFLFVIHRANIPDPPAAKPEFSNINRLVTASWADEDKAYLLATEAEDPEVLRNLLR